MLSSVIRSGSAVLIAAAALATAACGSGDSDDDSTSQPTGDSPEATTETAPSPPRLTRAGVERYVRDHYRDLDAGRIREAFSHFAPGLQAELGPFSKYREGYALTEETRLTTLDVRSVSRRRAQVAVELSADVTDACGDSISQTFAGRWEVELSGRDPIFVSADFTQTGGREPSLAESECPDAPTTPPATSGDNCTPGYDPCLPPASDYDCKDGTGDGPEYTGEVRVTGADPYDLDRDGNGIGCEGQLPAGPVG